MENNYTEINWIQVSKDFLKWGCWIYKEEVDQWFYTTDQYIQECKAQWLEPLTVEDLKQIGFTEEWTGENRQLADKLWLRLTGYVDADGKWDYKDAYGYLCSASPVSKYTTRAFTFDKEKGELDSYYFRDYARPCLYRVKNSVSDNLSIWLFEQIVERAEKNKWIVWAKEVCTLGKILLDNK